MKEPTESPVGKAIAREGRISMSLACLHSDVGDLRLGVFGRKHRFVETKSQMFESRQESEKVLISWDNWD